MCVDHGTQCAKYPTMSQIKNSFLELELVFVWVLHTFNKFIFVLCFNLSMCYAIIKYIKTYLILLSPNTHPTVEDKQK